MKPQSRYHPYALVTILCWSLAYVLTRLSLRHFSAFSLGFLRYLVATVSLAVIMIGTRMKWPRTRDLPWFVLAGAVGFFFYMIAFNQGQATVTAATGSVIIATVPVITALFASILYRERLSACQWAAILVEFIGVAVLTLMHRSFSVNAGLFWLFGAAFALSAYNLIQRRLTRTYTALQTTTFGIFFGTLLLTVYLPASVQEIARAPAIQLFYLAILGIFSSAIAYVSWAKAMTLARKTSQVSNYMFITPLLTSILGFLIAREVPDRATFVGGGIILAGILLFNFGDSAVGTLSHQRTDRQALTGKPDLIPSQEDRKP
jgi:drug/metabolite transporter (DMT)-like permease